MKECDKMIRKKHKKTKQNKKYYEQYEEPKAIREMKKNKELKYNKEKYKQYEEPKAVREMKKSKKLKNNKEKYKQHEEPKAVRDMKTNKNLKSEIIQEDNKPSKKKKIKKIIVLFILIVFGILGIKLGIYTYNWKLLAKDMLLNKNSIVKDIDGDVIATLGSEKKQKNISLNEIPENLKNAYIAIEDERFYSHNGIDIKRTASAIGSYIIHLGSSSFGGSTITQQLVKNLTGDTSESITRKITEWWRALQLETCASKDEILQAYFNIIYVGPSIYGVEAGSVYYFSKSAKDLSLEECAFLAGINHSPNSYNPFSENKDEEKIIKRTQIVLSKMKDLGYIKSEEEYNNALQNLDNGLKFKKGEISSDDGVYSYHTDALISEITDDIAKKYNISTKFASNYIDMANLTIYSTQDTKIQKETEKEFEKKKYSLISKNGKDFSQAAMVIINQKTGYVVACTGGLGEKTTARPLNRATQSVRQTGSAIKPIAVLAPAIDKKIITASTVLDDTEKDFANNYHPIDYSKSLGKVTVRRAVESSQNIPFVEITEKLTPKTAIKYLEKMGITSLTDKDNNLALSLRRIRKRN